MAGIIGVYWAHLALMHDVLPRREVQAGLALSIGAFALLLLFGIFPFVNNWGALAGVAVGCLVALPALGARLTPEGGLRVRKAWLALPAALVLVTLIVCAGYYFYTNLNPYTWCSDCHWVECIDTASWHCSPPAIPAICFQEPVGSYDANDGSLTHGWC